MKQSVKKRLAASGITSSWPVFYQIKPDSLLKKCVGHAIFVAEKSNVPHQDAGDLNCGKPREYRCGEQRAR